MKRFIWARIFMSLLFTATFSSLLGQADNYTFEANNPGDIIATHDVWENDNIVFANGFQAVWGTTLDFSPKNTVYLQCIEPTLGAYNQLWDGMYYSANYEPFLKFHGMAEDASQVVVAASQAFDNQMTTFPYIFSVDLGSGAVLWATPIITGDAVSVSDMQIIQDAAGDFVVAISFQTFLPTAISPADWSGVAMLKLDPAGGIIWFESVREQSNIPELFRLTDLEQSSITGDYVVAGAYSGNGPLEEAFVMEFDQGSGAPLGAPLNLYDLTPGPEAHISITDDGANYYLSYHAFGANLGLAVLDPAFAGLFAAVYPPFGGKSNLYTDDINYVPALGGIELMLTMQDFAGVFSTGMGFVSPGSIGSMGAREFDYAPGFKEAFPVGYVSLTPSIVNASSYLFLAHPTFGAGGILPFPSNDNYIRMVDASPTACIPPNPLSTSAFGQPVIQGAQGLVNDSQVNPIFDFPVQDIYDGVVYDCGLAPFAIYRKAAPELEPTISLFPNPVQNNLTLEGELSDFDQVELYDAAGRMVKSDDIRKKLSVGDLSPGMYHLILTGDNARKTLKFVKQ